VKQYMYLPFEAFLSKRVKDTLKTSTLFDGFSS